MNPEHSPEIIKKGAEKDISKLAEGYFGDGKEVKDFVDFVTKKIEKMSRRDLLKIAGAIGLSVGYKYFEKNIDNLWQEYQKEKTTEVKKEFKDLQSSTELLEKIDQYPEMIKKSEKQTLNEFAKDLSKKDFDNLIIGEWHGFGPTSEKAAHLLEELIKNNKKISAICLEGLSYTDPEHIGITKKINERELPLEKMPKIIGPIELIKLATKYSIEIIGMEKGKIGDYRPDEYSRFREMSERIGEISKERAKDGIVVAYVGQRHVTVDSWENDILLKQLAEEKNYYNILPKEEALENNYTIKEYLEKMNLRPVAIQIEDWAKLTKAVDSALAVRLENLSPKDKKLFYEEAKNKWQNYILEEKDDFVVPYPKGKDNTFAMVIPSKVPEIPSSLLKK